MGERKLNRSLVGAGLMLALVVVGLFLAGLTDPAPGLAAPAPAESVELGARGTSGVTQELSPTVFLPILVHPAPPITPNVWQGEYYANTSLSGEPAYTTEGEVRIDHDWGDDSSPPGLPMDYFSIRWTGHWDFEVGEYTFFVFADDGVRLWLDDELLIDAWGPGIGHYQKKITIWTEGLHELKLEYFDQTGGAAIRLHWRRTDLYPQWRGEYFREPWVEGGKMYEQTDSTIQFDWGTGNPPNLPYDGFSVAWNANLLFKEGTYRIYLYADDGYQLFVDGNKVKEGGWHDGQGGGREDDDYVLEIGNLGYHHITYNFHDRGSLAEARLWIEHLEHPRWDVEYYANQDLSGPPHNTGSDSWVFHDWEFGRPSKVPSGDHFSIRWSGERYFHSGCYRFGLFVDDGVRLWVDGELLVNEWHDSRSDYHSPVTYLSTGYHDVVVEYYENSGEAEIRLWWE